MALLKCFGKSKYVFLEVMIKFFTNLCIDVQLCLDLKVGYIVNKNPIQWHKEICSNI